MNISDNNIGVKIYYLNFSLKIPKFRIQNSDSVLKG